MREPRPAQNGVGRRKSIDRKDGQNLRPHEQSEAWHARAERVIIGGVNSPSRSYQAVGGKTPVTVARAHGAHLFDVDGNRYIDYLAAFGPVIAGHGHPHIREAVCAALEEGALIGTPTPWETLFAERLQQSIPELERIRFVNSGTEAIMSAIRVARAYTGRTRILKFAGCYHGHSDLVLVAAGSGPSSLGIPDSAGVPPSIAQEVVTVPFNDPAALDEAMRLHGPAIACILVEPVVGNFGIVQPRPGFLRHVREAADRSGALLVYDEVITAFRFRFGAVRHDQTEPDLMVLGKIIGGGLPIGAYGGRRAIMEQVAPLGPAYQAGTMAGNPASIRAGMACLDILEEPGLYDRLARLAQHLTDGIAEAAAHAGVPVTVNRYGGAFACYFGVDKVTNYAEAVRADGRMFAAWFRSLLEDGVMLAPSKYEAWFVSAAHTEADVEETLRAVPAALRAAARAAACG